MEIVLFGAVLFIIGIFTGFGIGKMKYRQWPIGDLRIDQSDPDSPPNLFLELDAYVPVSPPSVPTGPAASAPAPP